MHLDKGGLTWYQLVASAKGSIRNKLYLTNNPADVSGVTVVINEGDDTKDLQKRCLHLKPMELKEMDSRICLRLLL